MPLLTKLRFISLALISSIILALVSIYFERVGPELVQYGDLCGPGAADPCYQPVLKAGFPIAYLFDAPGVSVERQLSFGEDKLYVGALLLDIAIYFAATLAAIRVISGIAKKRAKA